MKQLYFTCLLALLLCMMGNESFAYDIYVDGNFYSWINHNKELAFTAGDYDYPFASEYGHYPTGKIKIPQYVTYNGTSYPVTAIYNAFRMCYEVTEITIPKTVTIIEESFEDCCGLESIIVEPGNTVYDSRNDCNAIIETSTNTLIAGCKTTIIPNSVTSIGEKAFCRRDGLINMNIPNSVKNIANEAFYCCYDMISVNIPNSVTSIGRGAFRGCI